MVSQIPLWLLGYSSCRSTLRIVWYHLAPDLDKVQFSSAKCQPSQDEVTHLPERLIEILMTRRQAG